jgi:hypothetical protein
MTLPDARNPRTHPQVTTSGTISPRPAPAPALPRGRLAPGLLRSLGLMLASPQAAFAQGKLDAQYEATLAGIPVGKGAWTIDIADDQFSAAASGGTSGLLKAFAGGSGTGALAGPRRQRRAGRDQLFRHHHHEEEDRDHPHRRSPTATSRNSPSSRSRRSIPTASRHRGASPRRLRSDDGIAAARARHRRSARPRGLPHRRAVFDGRMRYDLKLDFKRMETVKAEKGYRGPVVVCALYFTPVAGYIPDRPRSNTSPPSATSRSRSRRSREPASWCRSG